VTFFQLLAKRREVILMELSQESTRPCAELDPNLSVKPPFGPIVAEIALWDRDGDTVTTDAGNPRLRHNG